jgi:D-galactarolactone cycloisomerase
MPFSECVPKDMAESALRRDLLREDLEVVDGHLVLPDGPGLGIELDEAALHRFERAASARWAG